MRFLEFVIGAIGAYFLFWLGEEIKSYFENKIKEIAKIEARNTMYPLKHELEDLRSRHMDLLRRFNDNKKGKGEGTYVDYR